MEKINLAMSVKNVATEVSLKKKTKEIQLKNDPGKN